MPPSQKRIGTAKSTPVLQRIEQLHPYELFCYLTIASRILFHLFLIITFLQKSGLRFDVVSPLHFPRAFHISAIALVATLTVSTGIVSAYNRDEVAQLRRKLSYMIVSGLALIILQALSWIELLAVNDTRQVLLYNDYLYLFSGILAFHIMASTVFIAFQFYRIAALEGDPVKALILVTNPYEKVKLEIYSTFWHFTVALWLCVYLFYLLVY